MTTMRRPYYYHGGEEVAADGRTIVSSIMQGDRCWPGCWSKKICIVPRDRVRIIVGKLNDGIYDAEIEAIEELK